MNMNDGFSLFHIDHTASPAAFGGQAFEQAFKQLDDHFAQVFQQVIQQMMPRIMSGFHDATSKSLFAAYTPQPNNVDTPPAADNGASNPKLLLSSGNNAPPPAKPSGNQNDNDAPPVSSNDPAKAIADDLEQRYGLTPTQAAGVLGNLQQESGLQSNINQGGATGAPSGNFADNNQNGWGLAQWGGSRKQGEIDYAKDHGLDPGSLQANIGFMNEELDGPYSKTITDLKQTNNVNDAARVWDEDYEQASDPQMGSRDQYAENFLQKGL